MSPREHGRREGSSPVGHGRLAALHKPKRRRNPDIYVHSTPFLFVLACPGPSSTARAETREVAQSLNRLPRLVTITEYIDTAHNTPCAPSPPVYFLRLPLPTPWKPRDRDLERAYDEFLVSPRFSRVPRGLILRQISRNFHAATFVIIAKRCKERSAGRKGKRGGGGRKKKKKTTKREN